MEQDTGSSRALAHIGSGFIAYAKNPRSFGPAPDAVVFQCQAERGYFLSEAFTGRLRTGLERCSVGGDGIVDVRLDFALDDADGILLNVAFHAIFDVGEDGYEETLG